MPRPHEKQRQFINSDKKRIIVRAGRRGGKTVGVSIHAAKRFLSWKRILYAAPTQDQVERFWTTVCRIFEAPINSGIFRKNETKHVIEHIGTEYRIRAKTAWNSDTLRGDYADELILDEFQLMNEETWGVVGAPMLADNNGNATFIYTPPSLSSRSASKANDPQHAAKMYKKMLALNDPRWGLFHFTSFDNPHISREALDGLADDMTSLAYRMEIMAEDVDEVPGALWKRATLDTHRQHRKPDRINRMVIGVDPSATSTGDEAGVVAAGSCDGQGYVLEDCSLQGSPLAWAQAAVAAYHRHQADEIVAESNQGGEMVALTIAAVDASVPVRLVHASRGKQVRADPVAALYEHGKVHHVGVFPHLEDELCLWSPGGNSPNRLDALVYAITALDLQHDIYDTPDYTQAGLRKGSRHAR
jgi:hypothetical protein